jgi:glucan phosphoethanolaminetransferase (alkaline phosphatase superfamily)
MSRWLESHVYIAEWIAALAVVRSLWQDSVRPILVSTKRAVSVAAGYVFVRGLLLYLRLFSSKESLKEAVNLLVFVVIAAVFAESLKKAKNQTNEPTWTW